jgi:hypothetical protein
MPEIVCQNMCSIDCQTDRLPDRLPENMPKECQIEGHTKCQIECHNPCPIESPERLAEYMSDIVRVGMSEFMSGYMRRWGSHEAFLFVFCSDPLSGLPNYFLDYVKDTFL